MSYFMINKLHYYYIYVYSLTFYNPFVYVHQFYLVYFSTCYYLCISIHETPPFKRNRKSLTLKNELLRSVGVELALLVFWILFTCL